MHDTLNHPNDPADERTRACLDRLRGLPSEMQPPYNWQEFQRRAREGEQDHPAFWSIRANPWQLAAAVALLVVVCGAALWGHARGGVRPQLQELADSASGSAGVSYGAQLFGSSLSANRVVDSRAIESWLATLPREPIVVRVGTRAAVARLEDRIAQVDDLLTAERIDGVGPDRLTALQQERIRLVGSLAQVRYAEVVASELP